MRTRTTVAWVVTVMLTLGACSDDDEPSAASDEASTTVTTAQGDTSSTETSTTEAPTCVPPELLPNQLTEVNALISATAMASFVSLRHDGGYIANHCWHNWTTDDCSAPGLGSTGLSYNFISPCQRHDFGYRNYKRIDTEASEEIWNAENKFATDDQFLEDTREHCSTRIFYLKAQCLAWAQTYYYAVRAFG